MSTAAKTAKLLRMRARFARTKAESRELHIKAAYLESKVLNAGQNLEPEEESAGEVRGSRDMPLWFTQLRRSLKCKCCGGSPATWYTKELRRPRLFAFLKRSAFDDHAEDVLRAALRESSVLCRKCLLNSRNARATRAESGATPCDSTTSKPPVS